MTIEESKLKEIIEYLEKSPKVNKELYPEYDGLIFTLLGSLDTDSEYLENYFNIEDKDIATLSLDELATMYTYLERGERFCTGLINEYIENGKLLKLARRQLELTKE